VKAPDFNRPTADIRAAWRAIGANPFELSEARIASNGCAAPTFGRGWFNVTAAHIRPKVGATRAVVEYLVVGMNQPLSRSF
jgi:hypothetical protein